MTGNRGSNVEIVERAVPKNHPGFQNSAEGCPPDFLVRAAVLRMAEPILSHVAECPHCMNVYMGALGGDWHRGRRPH